MPVARGLHGPVPFVMAHRGFDLDGLENSMRAFEAAVRLGVDFLETDVRATQDGVLLAFHDATLHRVTDRRGRISQLSWDEVRRARIRGLEPVPRLEEVLAAWPDVRLNVDLKERGAVAPFVETVRRAGARDRICVASFSDLRRTEAVRALEGEDGGGRGRGGVAWSPGVMGTVRVLAAVRRGPAAVARALAGAACLQLPPAVRGRQLVTPALVDAVHRAGAQVHVWTIDDPDRMRALLDLGVDGIVTNRSDLALAVLRERGPFVP